ncbi:site-specific integrase [Fusobacterium sp. SB021]
MLSIVKGKEKLIFQDSTKTKNSVRTLPINNKLIELLIMQKNMQKEKLFGSSDLVVTNELNKPFRPDFLTKKFKKIIANYNISNFDKLPLIRFHDSCHTCATLLYEAGVDIKTIQYWLGHSSIRVTLDIYTEFSKAKLNSAKDITNVIDNEFEEK